MLVDMKTYIRSRKRESKRRKVIEEREGGKFRLKDDLRDGGRLGMM